MNIFRSKYIKNIFSLLFFISIVWIVLDSILRTTTSSYLLEEKIFLGIIGFIYSIYLVLELCRKKINIVSILFLSLIMISLISSLVNGLSIDHCYTSLFYHLTLVFVFSYFSSYKNNLDSRFKFILYAVALILFGYALVNLMLYILINCKGISLPFESWKGLSGSNRLVGITGNPAATGVLAYMGIITQVYLFSKSNKRFLNIIFTLVIVGVDCATLVLSDARGSLISLFLLILLTIIYFFIKHSFKNKYFKYILLVIFLGIISLLTVFMIYRFLGMNRSIHVDFSDIKQIESFLETLSSARYSLWKETLQLIMNKPFLGVGIDNLAPAADKILQIGTIVGDRFEGPHNVLLDVAVSSGLIGLTISLVIFFFIFRSCYILMKKQYTLSNVVLVAGIVGMFIISLFDYGIFFRGRFMSPLFWMFSGYAYCLSKRVKS